MNMGQWGGSRRRQALLRLLATGTVVLGLAVAVPMMASGQTGGAVGPGVTSANAAAFIASAQRPIVDGTLSEVVATTTDLGVVSLWTYQVTDNGGRSEVMLTVPDHPLAFGRCPTTTALGFCIATLGGPGSPLIVAGATTPGASSVVASYADGTTVKGQVQNNTWILQLPGSDATGSVSEIPRSFSTFDAAGNQIATSDLGIPTMLTQHNSAVN